MPREINFTSDRRLADHRVAIYMNLTEYYLKELLKGYYDPFLV